MFGSSASPFQLVAVLHTLIKNDCHNKKVQQALESGIYVDNVIYATYSEDQLLEFFDVFRDVFTGGSFNLRQWVSNSLKLRGKSKNPTSG